MRDVLREVREELGPDALVVSTRTHRRDRRWFGKLSQPVIEVTAAVDRDLRRAEAAPDAAPRVVPDPSWNELRLTRALVSPLESEIRSLRATVERLAVREAPGAQEDLTQEVQRLRRLTEDFVAGSGQEPGRAPLSGDPYTAAGLDPRHAVHLSEALRSGPLSEPGGAPSHAAVRVLAARLEALLQPPRPASDTAVLYVGPPGAGKTTTLAKRAGRDAAMHEDLVVLSTDMHRLGASGILRAYAKQLDVPFRTSTSASGLEKALSRIGKRPILVDTPGRSRNDPEALAELQAFRDALGSRGRVCLVLPATMKEGDLRRQVDRYRVLEPDAMVLTKIDESDDCGNVANLLLDEGCPPLTWIADGQRVPGDLHVADPDDLALRILGVAA